jgi:hypothetical protein
LQKSVQSIENKRPAVEKERQESSRARNRLEGKKIEEVEDVKEFRKGKMCKADDVETKVRRTFTSYDRSVCRNCQYVSGF